MKNEQSTGPDDDLWVVTLSGARVSLINPTPEMICLDDIVDGLSISRFNSHTKDSSGLQRNYTVLQHSVWVADCLRRWGFDRPTCLKGLLHDAPEAYWGDDISPKKWLIERMVGFDVIGRLHEPFYVAIMQALNVEWPWDDATNKAIKQADLLALVTEHRDLLPDEAISFRGEMPEPHDIRIEPWDAVRAQSVFRLRYWDLQFNLGD